MKVRHIRFFALLILALNGCTHRWQLEPIESRETASAGKLEREKVLEEERSEDRSATRIVETKKYKADLNEEGRCEAGDTMCAAELPEPENEEDDATGRRGGEPTPAAAQVEHVELPDGVMTAVSASVGELSECVPESLRLDPSLRIEVSARLSSAGAFRDLRVSAGALLDPEIEQCIVAALLRVRVPDYDGDSRTVSFPLFLQE